MSISSIGVGSGLDVKTIVEQLVALERQPESALDSRASALQAEISAFGSLKSAVSSFNDAITNLSSISKYKVFRASSSDSTVLSASADSTAARGSYSMEVSRIAETHRMASQTTFADSGTTTIGTSGDTMTITAGTSAFTVTTGGLTLAGVRDAINNATDNTGVTASLVRDNSGYRLLLSANETGSAHAVTTSYSAADPFSLQTLNTDRDQSGSFTPVDLDAAVKLEGQFDITSSSNTLTDTVQGVTINLLKAGTTTLTVDRDTASVQSSIQNFASTYSALVNVIGKLANGDLSSEKPALYSLESQLRGILNTNTTGTGTFANIFEIGASTSKTGSLTVDSTMLTNALNKDFNSVADLFANASSGLAVRLKDLATQYMSTGGPIDGRTQGLSTQIRDLAARRARIEQHALAMQDIYTKQYTALDTLVSQLKTTGNYLTQQISLMNKSAISG